MAIDFLCYNFMVILVKWKTKENLFLVVGFVKVLVERLLVSILWREHTVLVYFFLIIVVLIGCYTAVLKFFALIFVS